MRSMILTLKLLFHFLPLGFVFGFSFGFGGTCKRVVFNFAELIGTETGDASTTEVEVEGL